MNVLNQKVATDLLNSAELWQTAFAENDNYNLKRQLFSYAQYQNLSKEQCVTILQTVRTQRAELDLNNSAQTVLFLPLETKKTGKLWLFGQQFWLHWSKIILFISMFILHKKYWKS